MKFALSVLLVAVVSGIREPPKKSFGEPFQPACACEMSEKNICLMKTKQKEADCKDTCKQKKTCY